MTDLNPHGKQMADESMVRTLDAQARAIWPGESGLADITIDYIAVDTIRVPRETFASILEAWRDGYVEPVAEYTRFTREEAAAYFNQMIANIRDPRGYAVWMVPVVSARVL